MKIPKPINAKGYYFSDNLNLVPGLNNVDIDSSIKKELESKTLFPWQSK